MDVKRGLMKDRGLVGDWGLNEGLKCVSCSNLQVLRCHPCACKLFVISFPLNFKLEGQGPHRWYLLSGTQAARNDRLYASKI
jgi:hypothetical protein